MSDGVCRFNKCGRSSFRTGYCRSHYRQLRSGQSLQPIRIKLPDGAGAAEALAKYMPVGLPDYECWYWRGAVFKNGYGVAHVPGRNVGSAHRLSWEIANGRQPDSSEHVRHLCENRLCVNPAHLQIGSRQDNMDDMVARARSVRGERNGMQRIPPGIILEIRRRAASGELQKHIANEFGISRSYVSQIVGRKRWAHI